MRMYGAAARTRWNGTRTRSSTTTSHALSGAVCSIWSYVNPALFTMWLSLPYFLQASVNQVFCTAQCAWDYSLYRLSDHLLREVVHGHIPAHSEHVAASRLDLVHDDLRLLSHRGCTAGSTPVFSLVVVVEGLGLRRRGRRERDAMTYATLKWPQRL